MTSFGRQFDFHDGIVTLTIDGVTSFLQRLDVQNVRKNTRFSLKQEYEGFVHIFIFLCVRIEINSH